MSGMGREIKFRAWDKKNKCMVYDSDLSKKDKYDDFDADDIIVTNKGVMHGSSPDMGYYGGGDWTISSLDIILMQYTGLKDKHGVEIYEGDIVHISKEMQDLVGEPEIVSIVYSEKYAGFTTSFGRYLFLFHGEWEVIGNIYEHPELLK